MGENNFSFYIFIIIAVISIINKFRKKDAANKKTPDDGFFKKKIKTTTFYNSRGQAIGKTEKEIERDNNNSASRSVQQQRNNNNSPIKRETSALSSKLEKFLIKAFNIPEDNPIPLTASSTQNEYNQTYDDNYQEEDYSSNERMYDTTIDNNEANEINSNREMSNLELARSEEYVTVKKKNVKYNIKNLLNSKNDMRKAILLAEIVNRKY